MHCKFTFLSITLNHTDHMEMVSIQCVLSDVTQDEHFVKILFTLITWKWFHPSVYM